MGSPNRLDIPDESGHATLTWDPADPASVETAKAEFDKLKAAGFAFYTTEGKEVSRPFGKTFKGAPSLEMRVIREFEPKAKQTVAMRPMRGG